MWEYPEQWPKFPRQPYSRRGQRRGSRSTPLHKHLEMQWWLDSTRPAVMLLRLGRGGLLCSQGSLMCMLRFKRGGVLGCVLFSLGTLLGERDHKLFQDLIQRVQPELRGRWVAVVPTFPRAAVPCCSCTEHSHLGGLAMHRLYCHTLSQC